MSLARWLVLIASIVLFAAGLLHVIGYLYGLGPALVKSGIDPRVLGAVKCVWFVFTVERVRNEKLAAASRNTTSR